jgi:hypothetical protein
MTLMVKTQQVTENFNFDSAVTAADSRRRFGDFVRRDSLTIVYS